MSLSGFVVLPFIPDDEDGQKGGVSMPGQQAHKQFNFMLKGDAEFKLAALSEAERYSWVTQLMTSTDKAWVAGVTSGQFSTFQNPDFLY